MSSRVAALQEDRQETPQDATTTTLAAPEDGADCSSPACDDSAQEPRIIPAESSQGGQHASNAPGQCKSPICFNVFFLMLTLPGSVYIFPCDTKRGLNQFADTHKRKCIGASFGSSNPPQLYQVHPKAPATKRYRLLTATRLL